MNGGKCDNCDRPIPEFATFFWHCVCGYQTTGDSRGFFERNAGALLICAFVLGLPLRALSIAMGGFIPLQLFADILFAVLIICGICGFIARRRARNQERT